MKTIYCDVMDRLKSEVAAIRWIDFDTGQLDSSERHPVAFPCALLSISVSSAKDITDYAQDCAGRVRIRLAFDQQMRTGSSATASVRDTALHPYNIIADIYTALQGWTSGSFSPLSRVRQDREPTRNGLFIYLIEFAVEFEDKTAEK